MCASWNLFLQGMKAPVKEYGYEETPNAGVFVRLRHMNGVFRDSIEEKLGLQFPGLYLKMTAFVFSS